MSPDPRADVAVRAILRWPAGVAVCLGIALAAPAEEGPFQVFAPDFSAGLRASVGLGVVGRAEGEDASGSLAIVSGAARTRWMAWHSESGSGDECWLGMQARHTNLSGDLRLPAGAVLDGDYLDIGMGLTWRHRLASGGMVGAGVSGLASGQTPIDDHRDLSGSAMVFARIPLAEEGRDGLLLALNYHPEASQLDRWPVQPLVAWQGIRGSWVMILGIPFSMVTWHEPDVRVSAVIGPAPALSADRRLAGPLRLIGEVRWSVMRLSRDDRSEDDDRVWISQWEWSGGLACEPKRSLRFDLLGGVATVRRVGEDADPRQARRDGERLEAAPIVSLRGRFTF